MPSIQRKSKPAIATLVLPALLLALLAAIVAPGVALAAPPPPAESPQLAFEPGSYDFGLQSVNNGANQANLQLRNNGTEAVQVESVELAGPGSEAFWFGYNGCNVLLQPNETCSVQVYFSPRDANEYTMQLRANAGSYSFTADLSGTGGRASFQPSANPVDFGVAKVGSAGVTREIEVTNTGNMPGGMFIAVVAGGAIGSFQILDENCTGVELVPDATCTLQVRFQPVSEGVKKAMLGLFGESEGPTPLILTGVGAAADPAPSPVAAPTGAAGAATSSTPPSQPAAQPQKRKPKLNRRHRRHLRAKIHSARVLLQNPH